MSQSADRLAASVTPAFIQSLADVVGAGWVRLSAEERTAYGRDGSRAAAMADAVVSFLWADAAGNVQPDVPPWNRLGYGNNAIEVSYVDVR